MAFLAVVAFMVLGVARGTAAAATNQAPVAHFGSVTPFPASAGTPLTFSGWGSDEDGYIVAYGWDFDGDGVYDWNSTMEDSTSFAYTEAGIYQPGFHVRDNNGTWSVPASSSIQVGPAPPNNEGSEGGNVWMMVGLGLAALGLLALAVMAQPLIKNRRPPASSRSRIKAQTKEGLCRVCSAMIGPDETECKACGAPRPEQFGKPSSAPASVVAKPGTRAIDRPKPAGARRRLLARKKKPSTKEETVSSAGPVYLVEEVFLVAHDGRVMAHVGQVDSGTDYELVGGMFSAVMDFVKDSFGRPGYMGAIEYGDNRVFIEMGKHCFMALVVYGEPPKSFRERISDIVPRVETFFSGVVEKWSGDRELLAQATDFIGPLVMETAGVSRQQVQAAMAGQGVKLASAWEYYRGCVRLKVACLNHTDTVITDVRLDLDFDGQQLRLDHIEPDYDREGTRINLGLVEGGGKKTVAVAFDPLMCQKTSLNAIATYKDAKSELHTVKMKRRAVEVVCPLFFTPENASTATLRRLVEQELAFRDSKVFLLPERLKAPSAFELGKETLEGRDVKFVKQFIQPDPYRAEAWYYGVTKVKQEEMVIRVSVEEEAGLVSLFAAAGKEKSLAGLLAELAQDLQKSAAGRGFRLKSEADRLVRDEILAASYLLEELENQEKANHRDTETQSEEGREEAGEGSAEPALPEVEPEPTDIVLPEKRGKGKRRRKAVSKVPPKNSPEPKEGDEKQVEVNGEGELAVEGGRQKKGSSDD